MTVNRCWLWCLVLLLSGTLFLGFDIGGRAISSPTEGRYVQIPMGMLATGDFVIPRLNGVIYFEKPPLYYWLEAASLAAFGVSEWSARLVPALFTLLTCIVTGLAARRFYGGATAVASAVVLATSVFFYVNGRTIQIDMVVSALIVATMFLFIAGATEPDRRRQVWLFRGVYLAAALAVLAKGLIGIVLPGFAVFVWIVLTGRWRLVPRFLIPSGLVLFALVAVPWHAMADMRNGDFLRFYFVHEHFTRFTTTQHARTQPFWFFLPVVLFGFLPWSGDMIAGIVRALPRRRAGFWAALRADPVTLFLVVWAACIVGFFSMSGSKLAPYVLPAFPPLAILAGRIVGPGFAAGRGGSALGRWMFAVTLGVLGIALLVLPNVPAIERIRQFPEIYAVVAPYIRILAAVFILSAAATVALQRLGRPAATVPVMLLSAVLGWTTLSLGASALSPNTVRPLALDIRDRLRPGDAVASFGTLFYDLPVYVGRNVLVVDSMAEFNFGATQEDIGHIAIGSDELWRRWDGPERIYMLVRPRTFDGWGDRPPRPVHLLGRTVRAVSITNRPPDPK